MQSNADRDGSRGTAVSNSVGKLSDALNADSELDSPSNANVGRDFMSHRVGKDINTLNADGSRDFQSNADRNRSGGSVPSSSGSFGFASNASRILDSASSSVRGHDIAAEGARGRSSTSNTGANVGDSVLASSSSGKRKRKHHSARKRVSLPNRHTPSSMSHPTQKLHRAVSSSSSYTLSVSDDTRLPEAQRSPTSPTSMSASSQDDAPLSVMMADFRRRKKRSSRVLEANSRRSSTSPKKATDETHLIESTASQSGRKRARTSAGGELSPPRTLHRRERENGGGNASKSRRRSSGSSNYVLSQKGKHARPPYHRFETHGASHHADSDTESDTPSFNFEDNLMSHKRGGDEIAHRMHLSREHGRDDIDIESASHFSHKRERNEIDIDRNPDEESRSSRKRGRDDADPFAAQDGFRLDEFADRMHEIHSNFDRSHGRASAVDGDAQRSSRSSDEHDRAHTSSSHSHSRGVEAPPPSTATSNTDIDRPRGFVNSMHRTQLPPDRTQLPPDIECYKSDVYECRWCSRNQQSSADHDGGDTDMRRYEHIYDITRLLMHLYVEHSIHWTTFGNIENMMQSFRGSVQKLTLATCPYMPPDASQFGNQYFRCCQRGCDDLASMTFGAMVNHMALIHRMTCGMLRMKSSVSFLQHLLRKGLVEQSHR